MLMRALRARLESPILLVKCLQSRYVRVTGLVANGGLPYSGYLIGVLLLRGSYYYLRVYMDLCYNGGGGGGSAGGGIRGFAVMFRGMFRGHASGTCFGYVSRHHELLYLQFRGYVTGYVSGRGWSIVCLDQSIVAAAQDQMLPGSRNWRWADRFPIVS